MRALELKVPPPLAALMVGVAMWGIAQVAPALIFDDYLRWGLAAVLVAIGVSFAAAGFIAFRRAKTTINPMQPEKATSLVSTGVYRITRNPMYVGLLFLLTAWAVILSSPWSLLGLVVFYLWISRFQIVPEERSLITLFGEEYVRYTAKVRRWL